MNVYVNPTFLLKGIDYYKVLKDYNDGVYTRTSCLKSKLTLNNNIILSDVFGSSNDERIYCLKDNHNNDIICTTSGFKNVEVFTKSGGHLPMGGRCEYCREDYTTETIGIPLEYEEFTILTNKGLDDDKPVYKLYYTFWVDGKFCSFECVLSFVLTMLSTHPKYRDITYKESDKLLKFMYKLLYPNSEELRSAHDPRLLIVNGGSLTKEEWQNNKVFYKKTNNIIMIPVKVEYIREKI